MMEVVYRCFLVLQYYDNCICCQVGKVWKQVETSPKLCPQSFSLNAGRDVDSPLATIWSPNGFDQGAPQRVQRDSP